MISTHIQAKFNKTVLILGSNSFVAKNVISRIPYKKIVCIQLKKVDIYKNKNLKYYFLNLINLRNLKKIFRNYKFDMVIICASNNNNSIKKYNDNINIFKYNTNILLNVLELLKFNKKTQIINFSSTETLKKNNSIYSIAKTTNDQLCKFYQKNYNLNIKNYVISNLFGQNDLNFNRIIPLLIKKLIFNKKINKINYSKKLKFVFIDDLLENLIYPKKKIYGHLISIRSLIKKIDYLFSFSEHEKKKNQSLFEYRLYMTILWYKNYFKNKV